MFSAPRIAWQNLIRVDELVPSPTFRFSGAASFAHPDAQSAPPQIDVALEGLEVAAPRLVIVAALRLRISLYELHGFLGKAQRKIVKASSQFSVRHGSPACDKIIVSTA